MTGTDLCVNKPQSVPVIFEPPCIYIYIYMSVCVYIYIYIYIHREGQCTIVPIRFCV